MRKLIHLSDKELLQSLRNGHQQAFEVLFLRYKTDLQKVILHYVKDKVLTEDLLQDAFIKIYTSVCAGRYNDEGKFLPWSLRIAHNLCMDHLRKAKRLPSFQGEPKDEAHFVPTESCAETALIKKEQEQQLYQLIHHLPEDQKKVVAYRYYEELSFKEISEVMNTSVNTSLGRMRYALLHLRKQVNNNASFAWR